MKCAAGLATSVLLCAAAPASGGEDGPVRRASEQAMDGDSFLAVRAAADAAATHVRVERCRIQVSDLGDRLQVEFLDPARSPSALGCDPGACGCWVVEVAKEGRRVVRSHGVR